MTSTDVHPQSAEIIAALRLRPRPGLHVDSGTDETGHLVILEESADPLDAGVADAIVGLAIREEDGWYLGCTECQAEIEEADGGMCRPCREDLAFQEQQILDAQETW